MSNDQPSDSKTDLHYRLAFTLENNQIKGIPCTHKYVSLSPKISGLWKHNFMLLSYLELRIVLEYQISNQYSNFHDCAIDTYGRNLDHLKVPALPAVTQRSVCFCSSLYSLCMCVGGWGDGEKPVHQGHVFCWQYPVFHFIYFPIPIN